MNLYADGKKYKGQFKDGLFDGYGKMTYTDGGSYEGDFKAGERHGKGIFLKI